MRWRCFAWLTLLSVSTAGCGNFVAHRMLQAPNSYPQWLAPVPRVQLTFAGKYLTNFPPRFLTICQPKARLRYRVIDPADFDCVATSTNWTRRGHANYRFTFRATVPGQTNEWTAAPRGTVVLIHGYGVGDFAMSPWALRLAQDGWRCVLLDLRGHGKSTGKRIYYGVQEVHDLSQLLDQLGRDGQLTFPVHAVGDSYGAALSLRWRTTDPRISAVVAMAPYAHLSNAVVNICHDYARWLPPAMLRAGLRELPSLLKVHPDDLDTVSIVSRDSKTALFIAGEKDEIAPLADVRELCNATGSASKLVIVPNATHEALPYFFDELVAPVLSWLREEKISATTPANQTVDGGATGYPSELVNQTR